MLDTVQENVAAPCDIQQRDRFAIKAASRGAGIAGWASVSLSGFTNVIDIGFLKRDKSHLAAAPPP